MTAKLQIVGILGNKFSRILNSYNIFVNLLKNLEYLNLENPLKFGELTIVCLIYMTFSQNFFLVQVGIGFQEYFCYFS